MLAHKAVHEAHVAAEVIAGELQGNKELAAAAFNARVIPSVASRVRQQTSIFRGICGSVRSESIT
jgi:pyruvate/2-oxoglutarate dehydrogenase complex dihydrolipoamide dehydrogenase (E3) component